MDKLGSFSNIILQQNESILASRDDAIVSVDVGGKTVNSPVVLSNMPSCQNDLILREFNKKRWPYVYHRLGGCSDVMKFVKKVNDEDWYLKSVSVGVKPEDRSLVDDIKTSGCQLDWITIDVALIHNRNFKDHIKHVRHSFPNAYLIAGNLSNPIGVDWLHELGVDCCKFGIGVSTLCRTRQYTGFGSTLSDFSDCVASSKIDLMFDGGLTILDEHTGEVAYGDIFKALNLGAKFVMSSALFRWAHELSQNGIVVQYGNSTARAKNHHKHVEGAVKTFTSQYSIEEQMVRINDHLRSSISYAGIDDVKNAFQSCKMKFI